MHKVPQRPNLSRGEGLVRTHDLLEHLAADVYKTFEILEADKASQYLRRCATRTVFSFIEGMIQIMKWEIRSSLRRGKNYVELSKKEQEVLDEEKIKDGKSVKIFIPLDENLKKTLRIAAKVWGLKKYSPNIHEKQYKEFLAAKSARNKLTHPRTYYDIMVTDSDMHCYVGTFFWVKSEFLSLWDERIEMLATELPVDVRKKMLAQARGKSSLRGKQRH